MTSENKKLYRSRSNRMLCGVCGGLAEFFNLDASIIRLILVAACFLGFSGIIFYIIAAVVIPEEPANYPHYEKE